MGSRSRDTSGQEPFTVDTDEGKYNLYARDADDAARQVAAHSGERVERVRSGSY